MWEHRANNHPDEIPNFHPKSKDVVLALIAEQNLDVLEEFETMKRDFKGSFASFGDVMVSCMEVMKKEIIDAVIEDNRCYRTAESIKKQEFEKRTVTIENDKTECEKEKNDNERNAQKEFSVDEEVTKLKENDDTRKKQSREAHNDEKKRNNDVDKGSKKYVTKPYASNQNHKASKKEKISWIGTSISKVLDKEKVEKDLDVSLSITRAYCIKDEPTAKYRKTHFKNIVPKVVEKEEPDTLVLQTGSIEITNIEVNKALMDEKKSIDEYKKGWFEQVENNSKDLFEIAQEALKKNKKLKRVLILKRLPRHDRSSSDLIGMRSILSEYANTVYDQQWIRMGSPSNVIIIDLDLKGSGYFKELIYGKSKDANYDGYHVIGTGAVRQFTYQVIKQMKEKVYK